MLAKLQSDLSQSTCPAAKVKAVFSCIPLMFTSQLGSLRSLSTISIWLAMAAIINPEVVESTFGLLGVPVVLTSYITLTIKLFNKFSTYHTFLNQLVHPINVSHGTSLKEDHDIRRSTAEFCHQFIVETCCSLHIDASIPASVHVL